MDSAAPGLVRDLREDTVLAGVLPFFNDPAPAQRFAEEGILCLDMPHGASWRYLDLGGGDGFLALRVSAALRERGVIPTTTVVDGNARSLLVAQRAGLRVRRVAIEALDAPGTDLFTMRLVNHYNGLSRFATMLARIHRNLASTGYFVSQIETGSRRMCLYRSLLARRLDRWTRRDDEHARGESCRWITSDRYLAMLGHAGFETVKVVTPFMQFDTPLTTMLRFGLERFDAAGSLGEARRRDFVAMGTALAHRMLGPADGLDGEGEHARVRNTHVLFVVRRSAQADIATPSRRNS